MENLFYKGPGGLQALQLRVVSLAHFHFILQIFKMSKPLSSWSAQNQAVGQMWPGPWFAIPPTNVNSWAGALDRQSHLVPAPKATGDR